ncbi:MAG: hypothetical protein H6R05_261 [Burkholderiaceae bacterium]|nr:hypothetical protein [Burkholderiaceae bacterium]
MKKYQIYQHSVLGVEAVKVGFSWPAFFFNWVWMLFKRLWSFAAIWFIANIAFTLIQRSFTDLDNKLLELIILLVLMVGNFALWLIPAFKGNKWREEDLIKRGFTFLRTVDAENPEMAARKN